MSAKKVSPPPRHTSIRLDADIFDKVSELAKKEDKSVNEVISDACKSYVSGSKAGLCHNCNTQNPLNAQYCYLCGLPLDPGSISKKIAELETENKDLKTSISLMEGMRASEREHTLKLSEQCSSYMDELHKCQIKIMGLERINESLKIKLKEFEIIDTGAYYEWVENRNHDGKPNSPPKLQ